MAEVWGAAQSDPLEINYNDENTKVDISKINKVLSDA
jgi:hypothetical protein